MMRQYFRYSQVCLIMIGFVLAAELSLHSQSPTGGMSIQNPEAPAQSPSALAPKTGMPVQGAGALGTGLFSQAPVGEAVVTGNGISYNGGPVIGNPTAYFIWYGNWDGDTSLQILPQFISDLSTTTYANINTTYSDNFGNTVSDLVLMHNQTFDFYSQGSALPNGGVAAVVSNALNNGSLPVDSNGVYFVLTSPDVTEPTFCHPFCGYHSDEFVLGSDIKFAFVGNPSTQCASFCTASSNLSASPNNNPGADAMANVMTHELNESATDPDLNAWFRGNTEGEVGDLCNFMFGPESTLANGSRADFSVGGRSYLIQENWLNANGGLCAMSFSPPPTGQPSVQLIDNTRAGTNYQVGDSFTLAVHGAANQQVVVTQTTNGVTGAPFVFGQTDGNGNFFVSSTWGAANAGSYTQAWTVGGAAANPTLRFFVRPTVQLFDLTRGGTNYHSGDSFDLVIQGPPNQPVSVLQSKNGAAGSFVQLGQTDANGNFSLPGSWSPSDVGRYAQLWTVGSLQATPTLAIIVNP